jgi:hypothetical protein
MNSTEDDLSETTRAETIELCNRPDILTEISRSADKWRWMVEAHL